MLQYAVRRLFLFIPTILAVGTVVFVVLRVIPGDVAILILGGDIGVVDPKQIAVVRENLGLNDPIIVQYGKWLWNVVQFDFGNSLYTGEPVVESIVRKLPITAEIAIVATTLATAIAIPLGVIAALQQDRWADYLIRVTTITGLSAPSFWVAILTMLAIVYFFDWAPPIAYVSILDNPMQNLQMVVFPALSVAVLQTAVGTRMMRATMLEVLRQDYVTTARSKGLREQVVIVRHALKNAVLPVVTLLAMEFAALFGGLIITETVFMVPGLGASVVQSVSRRDYPMVQATVITMAVIVLGVNLLTDLGYGWLDPRIHYQ